VDSPPLPSFGCRVNATQQASSSNLAASGSERNDLNRAFSDFSLSQSTGKDFAASANAFRATVCSSMLAVRRGRLVQAWVARQGGRIVLHYLPTRAPEENPVERVFWRLHEAITRNQGFRTIDELVDATVNWMEDDGAGHVPLVDYSMAA